MPATQPPSSPLQPLQEENLRLRRAIEELSILNDLARAIGAMTNAKDIMHTIVQRSLRALSAEQGVITLVEGKADEPMKTLVRTIQSSAQQSPFHFQQSLMGWMHLNKKPLMINDPRADERFRGVKWDESVRSLLSVPMLVKSELRGVLTIYNKKGAAAFTEEDQRLLAIMAAQSAQVVENARLYESEQAFLRMREELRLAATIQTDLLPHEAPSVPGYDIVGKSVPAQLVGGDYYDFIPTGDGRLALCLGDVSGKGLPAALLMANLQATLRGQSLLSDSAKVCLERANRLLYQSTSADKFVTLFYSILDAEHHSLCFSNAGHENPILLHTRGDPVRLSTGGVVLSILDRFPFEEETIQLQPGDLLVAYSDGVTDAVNAERERFGEQRLLDLVISRRGRNAGEMMDAIVEAVHAHAGTQPQTDDMTLLVVRRTE